MPRFSANLRYLFQELPLYDRFAAAAEAGFKAVEYPFPYTENPTKIRKALEHNRLQMSLITAPPGNWTAGERGLASLPGREKDFRKSIEDAIYYATALDCPNIHVMSGMLRAGSPRESALSVLTENLSFAAGAFADAGISALIEPLNDRDMPGYLINHTVQARGLMAVVRSDNLKMLLNLYHSAMSGEDLDDSLRSNFDVIKHIQVAGVPGRAEPNSGTLDFGPVFELLDTMGYTGWIGCEYVPRQRTREGLKWASVYGIGSPFQSIEN